MPDSFHCVHVTRIRPGRLDQVNARLDTFSPDPEELRRQGIRSLQMYTTTETTPDGLVIAVLEGDDERAVLTFLEENENANRALIDELYEPHTHDPVIDAPVRFRFS